ncbi:hypothetical protein CVT25_014432 [Psilocybe cyanescens]|uniref:Uncharacterized protein n=1 Tax=Psilocybe cyanescens TaxID=93625 RepID=A0A409XR57_PSICY|nr:hypothetical protein CVT25_014432 [Psilocybe cyanescens]
MSLRIRIPPQKPSTSTAADDMEALEQPKRKRKPSKRFQDAEEEKHSHKAARTAGADKSRRLSNAEHALAPDAEDNGHDVDVIAYINEEDEEGHRSEYSIQHSVMSATTSQKSRSKNTTENQPRRKKVRRLVVSESESDEDFKAAAEDGDDVVLEAESEDDDDYISFEDKPFKATKGKGKGNSGRAGNGNKGIKRKAKADPDDTPVENKGSSMPAATSKKRLKLTPKLDDIDVDVVGGSVGTPEASVTIEHSSPAPATAKHDSPAPVVLPKKMKLPTIKKVKLPGTPGLNTPTSATGPAKKLPIEHTGAKGPTIEERKKLNLRGQTDIDLSNSAVYKELFLKQGSGDGITPRRAKEEERRKELNKMRDEFKAKRAAESSHSFDLQAQFDKISQFEEKLRAERSSALYPNFLAAKWREKFEKERKRQKEWAGANFANGPKEEGEVS